MKTTPVTNQDRHGVIAVPPLCRSQSGAINWTESRKVADYLRSGGITRLMYGGNAFLYHVTLAEYEALLEWLTAFPNEFWCIPAAGPSFGRLMDQAPILRRHRFPCAMALPCSDPRDAAGLADGMRRFSAAANTPLTIYLKDEHGFGPDLMAGLDEIAKLIDEGVCVAIKYALVRPDPSKDPFLGELLKRVDRSFVISGIGERPAIIHWRDFGLHGFTSGSVCLAPALTQSIFEDCVREDYSSAAATREVFIAHEDLRDEWGPARVLHAAVELANIAQSGAIPPFVSAITEGQKRQLASVAQALATSKPLTPA